MEVNCFLSAVFLNNNWVPQSRQNSRWPQVNDLLVSVGSDRPSLNFFDNADSRISALRKITGKFHSPELLDDGQLTAPSKKIRSQFPDYSKVTTGLTLSPFLSHEPFREIEGCTIVGLSPDKDIL